MKKHVISRDDSIYEAWPDLVLLPSGRLVVAFAECTHHLNRDFTRMCVTHSDDRGRTWSEKRAILPPLQRTSAADPFWNCPRLTHLRDGRILALLDEVRMHEKSGSRFKLPATMWIMESGDGGESWSHFCDMPPSIGMMPDRLLPLRCGSAAGRWITASHSVDRRPEDDPVWIVSTHFSDDEGKSWTGPNDIIASSKYRFCEPNLLELPDGTLVCFLRENSNLGLDLFKMTSRDGGATWSGLAPLPVPGCHRPVAGFLNSGLVMIAFRLKQGGMTAWGRGQQNLMVAVTDVPSCLATSREKAWCRIMPVDYDRSPDADCGYAGWAQFQDGEIYVASYIVDDAPLAQIRGYSFTEKDICLGDPAPGKGTLRFDANAAPPSI